MFLRFKLEKRGKEIIRHSKEKSPLQKTRHESYRAWPLSKQGVTYILKKNNHNKFQEKKMDNGCHLSPQHNASMAGNEVEEG